MAGRIKPMFPPEKAPAGNLETFAAGRILLRFDRAYQRYHRGKHSYPRIETSKELGLLEKMVKQYGEAYMAEVVDGFFLARELAAPPKSGPCEHIAALTLDVWNLYRALVHLHEAEHQGIITFETRAGEK